MAAWVPQLVAIAASRKGAPYRASGWWSLTSFSMNGCCTFSHYANPCHTLMIGRFWLQTPIVCHRCFTAWNSLRKPLTSSLTSGKPMCGQLVLQVGKFCDNRALALLLLEKVWEHTFNLPSSTQIATSWIGSKARVHFGPSSDCRLARMPRKSERSSVQHGQGAFMR